MIRKPRRTSQPQQFVLADFVNPLAQGLALLVNPVISANSAIPSGATWHGTPAQSIDPVLGRTLVCDGVNDAWSFPGAYRGTGTGAEMTLFAFFSLSSKAASRGILGTSNTTAAGLALAYLVSTDRLVLTKVGVIDITTAFQPAADTPYFFAASYRHTGGAVQFYIKNLLTGVVSTPTATNATALVAGDGAFAYGARQQAPNNTFLGSLGTAGVFNRALSIRDMAQIAENPWQLFRSQSPLLLEETASGGDVTVALTGAEATLNAGALVPSLDKAATGQAATGQQGAFATALLAALAGQSATISAGSAVPGLSQALSGLDLTTAPGSLTQSRAVPLSGQQAAAQRGSLTASGGVEPVAPNEFSATIMRASVISSEVTALLDRIASQAGTMRDTQNSSTIMRAAAINSSGTMRADALNLIAELL